MSSAALKLSTPDLNELSKKEFDFFSGLILNYAGIHLLENEKNYSLLNNRLRKVLRAHGIPTYTNLMEALETNPSERLKDDFISAMTTNKTEFYREKDHFSQLPQLLKIKLLAKTPIYIWSAACSTGQEPYTIAMHFHENYKPEEFEKVKILATDIDTDVLKTATEGFYTESQLEGLSPTQINTYFDSVADLYTLKPFIKEKVHFSKLNLFHYPFPINKKFDVIFCRNVLIYFKPEDRQKVCENLVQYLNIGGYLILGLSEAGSAQVPGLENIGNSTYRKFK
ncbi:MAG: hypothetical protein A2622_00615 [Bdellovibrionales bacterium RIFCSPHIGHO2_01_FULL_40_29]|nr:MAG: hypothetical protein A2622_00615 [Bdellovibrionales bacterium RIFCSPHIGHO2_01_FULL_40_29]OFZ32624.1 MAG: hypothetical protein A3D17_05215 [Bdellovibrionales bacterium RIFCSPHIGHO2_02_FULL_40_15]